VFALEGIKSGFWRCEGIVPNRFALTEGWISDFVVIVVVVVVIVLAGRNNQTLQSAINFVKYALYLK
jgi:hypothetical protein